MIKNLKEALTQYKDYTLELINKIKMEDYDPLEEILNKRQQIIEKINHISYTTEEFVIVVNQLELIFHENNLFDLMNEKRSKIKVEINKMSQAKNANIMYNKGIYNDPKIFNKKI